MNAYPKTPVRREIAALLSLAALIALAGCNGKGGPPQFPPPDVNVIRVATEPVTVFEEYVGQTEAVDTVEIRARLFDAEDRLFPRAHAEAWLLRDGRKLASLPLTADENETGLYRARTAPLTAGYYEVRVRVEGLPESEMKARTGFVVRRAATGELAELNCNEPLLRELAAHSGGRYFREEELNALVERLRPLSQGRVEESDTVLWQSWWWFGVTRSGKRQSFASPLPSFMSPKTWS